MNQVTLSGNLTADLETRDVGEHHLGKFTLACNEGDRAVFLPVECWNMPHLADYLHKGFKVLVTGRLKQEQWEAGDGGKRSRIVLTAHRVEFLTPAAGGSGPAGQVARAAGQGRPAAPKRQRRAAPAG